MHRNSSSVWPAGEIHFHFLFQDYWSRLALLLYDIHNQNNRPTEEINKTAGGSKGSKGGELEFELSLITSL